MLNSPQADAMDVSVIDGRLPPVPEQRLTAPAFVGFSMGMIGDRIFRDAPALLLLVYMTNFLAIPPAMAGVAIFIPKLLIMFIDPTVGTLSDRLQTRWGRRRPLMFVGALLASISFVLFFHVPHFAGPFAQACYMCAIVLLGFTGYSLYSVPYLTMASEIAGNDDERRKIMSCRVIFMAVGLSISAFAGGFVQWLGGDNASWLQMSWIYGAVCLGTMMATVLATGGIAHTVPMAATLSLFAQFRLVAGNARYMSLLLVSFLQKIGEGIGYGSFAYFCIYVVQQPLASIGLVVLASTAGQVLAQPFWLRASQRWSPTTLYTAGVLGWCLSLLMWLAMKGQSTLWLIPLGLYCGAAAGGFLMVTLSMLSNTMASDSASTGMNYEGVYSGIWLAAEKLGFALGGMMVGLILGLFGYIKSTNGAQVDQPASAVLGIAVTYCGVNIAIYLISILAVMRFRRYQA